MSDQQTNQNFSKCNNNKMHSNILLFVLVFGRLCYVDDRWIMFIWHDYNKLGVLCVDFECPEISWHIWLFMFVENYSRWVNHVEHTFLNFIERRKLLADCQMGMPKIKYKKLYTLKNVNVWWRCDTETHVLADHRVKWQTAKAIDWQQHDSTIVLRQSSPEAVTDNLRCCSFFLIRQS